jgi:hypothetical protein
MAGTPVGGAGAAAAQALGLSVGQVEHRNRVRTADLPRPLLESWVRDGSRAGTRLLAGGRRRAGARGAARPVRVAAGGHERRADRRPRDRGLRVHPRGRPCQPRGHRSPGDGPLDPSSCATTPPGTWSTSPSS